MQVRVDNKGFTFGDHKFIFNLYYFDADEWDALSLAAAFKKMLVKWADALQRIGPTNSPLFLPFAPDDQKIECLRATYWSGNKLTFSRVELGESGYAVDFSDLEAFNAASLHVVRESPEFNECDKGEVITSLLEAEVVES